MAVMAFKDIFITEYGYLGAAPRDVRKGDKIALFAGCKSPMVVREVGDKYRIMGPAHIPHIPQMIDSQEWPEERLRDFLII